MNAPSTQWREQPASDEETRFADYAAQFARMQAERSQRWGRGRALHRKQHLGVRAQLEVLADVPEPARHGLFARPGTYDARVRLSNGGVDPAADKRPDVRGFAIAVQGVTGPGALGFDTAEQDFLLINLQAFGFPTSDEFVGLVMSASAGPFALIRYMIRRYGLFGGFAQLRRVTRVFGQPFAGFALQSMYSAAPIACGPYAVKVRIMPVDNGPPAPQGPPDFAGDMIARLAKGDLHWHLQVQFYTDDETTPIEDASIIWPEDKSPFVTVARLTIPAQDPTSSEGRALAEEIDLSYFDPWNALAEHRPLGDAMRARKVVYYESQKGRGRT